MDCDDDPDRSAIHGGVELPLPFSDARDRLGFGELPRLTCMRSADTFDAFVRVVMLSLINAGNLNVCRPLSFPPWNNHRATLSLTPGSRQGEFEQNEAT